MQEKRIREILQEVCDQLDLRGAQLLQVAAGAALAMTVACSDGGSVATYMAPLDAGDEASVLDATDAVDSTPAMHYAAQFDTGVDSPDTVGTPISWYGIVSDTGVALDTAGYPVEDYGVPFDRGMKDATDGETSDATDAGAGG